MTDEPQHEEEQPASLYDVLGVAKEASLADIKKVWRDWARKNHPDVVGPGGDHSEFARRSAAAEILTDPERRERYDKTGKDRADPDKIRAAVLAIIQQIITSILNGGDEADIDIRMQDVSLRVLDLLNGKTKDFIDKRRKLERAKRRIKILQKRMKPRGKRARENDVVKAILLSATADTDRDEKFLNEAETIHFMVIETWADYRYDVGWGPEMDEQAADTARARLSPPPRRVLGPGDPT